MDSDQGKLFIGGISWDTTEDKLKDHFGNYGDTLSTSIMREKNTGKPRGFGFVVFADPNILDRVLEDKHVIDGRTVTLLSFFLSFLYFMFRLKILVLTVLAAAARWIVVKCNRQKGITECGYYVMHWMSTIILGSFRNN
ncbi:Heterogeneous nuclear ribonucleoprotein 1 [Glycine max]|nr:Heterogeneous nuclear ribonucleoprotein 1 [Glycine max]